METIGYIAASLTVLGFVPQVHQAVRTRKTRDISLTTFLVLTVSSTLWAAYGFGIHKPVVYLPNIILFVLEVAIVAVKISDRD